MNVLRRDFLYLLAGAAAVPAAPRLARAQEYPSRPVRIIVGFPAGGVGDILARLMGQWLSERLGQPFIVENRPGAGGNTATEVVVKALPDGYTLLFVGVIHAINATLYERLNYDFVRDVAPVAAVLRVRNVMVVQPSFPAKTIPEFIAFARANPGKVNMASAGNGTSAHVTGELFKMMAGVDMVHVPYRGGAPAVTDLLGGQVQVYFGPVPEFYRAHQSRQTASAGRDHRDPPGHVPGCPNGGGIPAGLRSERLARRWCAQEYAYGDRGRAQQGDQRWADRFQDQSTSYRPWRHAACRFTCRFCRLIAEETEKWGKVIRAANIRRSVIRSRTAHSQLDGCGQCAAGADFRERDGPARFRPFSKRSLPGAAKSRSTPCHTNRHAQSP